MGKKALDEDGAAGWSQFNVLEEQLKDAWAGMAAAVGAGPVHVVYDLKQPCVAAGTSVLIRWADGIVGPEGAPAALTALPSGLDQLRWNASEKKWSVGGQEAGCLMVQHPLRWLEQDLRGGRFTKGGWIRKARPLKDPADVSAALDGLAASGKRSPCPLWWDLLENKAMLVVLWELNKGHDNLLPAYWAPDAFVKKGVPFVAKSTQGRKGEAGVDVYHGDDGQPMFEDPYDDPTPEEVEELRKEKMTRRYERPLLLPLEGEAARVFQMWKPLPWFATHKGDKRYPVFGVWVVQSRAAGAVVREDSSSVHSTRPTVSNCRAVLQRM